LTQVKVSDTKASKGPLPSPPAGKAKPAGGTAQRAPVAAKKAPTTPPSTAAKSADKPSAKAKPGAKIKGAPAKEKTRVVSPAPFQNSPQTIAVAPVPRTAEPEAAASEATTTAETTTEATSEVILDDIPALPIAIVDALPVAVSDASSPMIILSVPEAAATAAEVVSASELADSVNEQASREPDAEETDESAAMHKGRSVPQREPLAPTGRMLVSAEKDTFEMAVVIPDMSCMTLQEHDRNLIESLDGNLTAEDEENRDISYLKRANGVVNPHMRVPPTPPVPIAPTPTEVEEKDWIETSPRPEDQTAIIAVGLVITSTAPVTHFVVQATLAVIVEDDNEIFEKQPLATKLNQEPNISAFVSVQREARGKRKA
jgi:hypothetical protein